MCHLCRAAPGELPSHLALLTERMLHTHSGAGRTSYTNLHSQIHHT